MGLKVIIAGGGTGGHFFPAVAVAEEISFRNKDAAITFVGTSRGLEGRVIPHTAWNLITMEVPSLKGSGLIGKLRAFLNMPKAFLEARRALKKVKPHIVIGVGGYTAGPVTLMAALTGIPSVAMEQNAIAGFTNRILGHFVDKVFITFQESAKYFPKRKIINSGNTVRKKIKDAALGTSVKKKGFTLLIFGGSQGAKRINETFLSALGYLEEAREDIHIIHQIGRIENMDRFSAAYKAKGFSAEVYHFIEDMGKAYSMADLVICRAGATSVAELTVVGKPAIFIPYPFAADNHQDANAKALFDVGACVIIKDKDLNGEALAQEIRRLIDEPFALSSMAVAMKRFGKPEAAKIIVDECMKMVAP
ncbi:MAG: undecaprenyldiphospho-muramoylpentapeptide beta-N-acetylglucosaminyltransferase [Deltaproteobacteria bacterium]|nr:undecaprenyldiphospho-muramoylpentapeptide beta-N-acetylglucosaminyltransferase [Deltaproteobacteria bacterium]